MTRNTITKARIILIDSKTKTFKPSSNITQDEATNGIDYKIVYSYAHLFIPASGEGKSVEELLEFSSSDCRCTHFPSFQKAKEFLLAHKKTISEKGKEYTTSIYNSSIHIPEIEVTYVSYQDTVTKKVVYSRERAEKWGKNLVFVDRRFCSHAPNLKAKMQFFTVSKEEESLLFEFFGIKYDDNGVPHIIVSPHNHAFRMYKDGRAYEVCYKESKRMYVDLPNVPIYAEDKRFKDSCYYYDDSAPWGYDRAVDLTTGECIEERYRGRALSETTKAILKEFGVPEFIFGGYYSSPELVESISEMARVFLKFQTPFISNETKILQEIATFLNNVPFDEEHSVVKYKNGYILRLGKINQCYKNVQINRYDNEPQISYRDEPIDCEGSTNELVSEQYIEYARLFISNTFSTRSLSFATDSGRRWRHEGIHLISNLFQNTPKETRLGIDVEARNRAALVQLYTIHPKLKYMKKYMEKHPDVLYNSCVPFLRALFQYDMILETLIALGKDNIFWKTERSRYSYYSYRGSRRVYEKTKEYFSMEEFVETFQLKDIPQKGDFYQRLGMTKQQFKLIFEDMEQANKLFSTIHRIRFYIPCEGHPNDMREIKLDGWRSKEERVLLRLVSYEDFRLIVEMIKHCLSRGSDDYAIANHINSLQCYYGNVKRVYKAICQRTYDITTLIDYMRMRAQLKQDQFPDFRESIWDTFPDDQEELQRYHDRIMFLDSENSSVKDIFSTVRNDNVLKTAFRSANDLYLGLKNSGITSAALKSVLDRIREIQNLSDMTVQMHDLITKIPDNLEELEKISENVEKVHAKFFNLYSMYWEEDSYRSYHSDLTIGRALRRWNGKRYRLFLTEQLAKDLDVSKYDLYLRLRRKFSDNDTDFKTNDYPYEISSREDLDRLYNELAAKEPELDRIIAERERARRERIRKEQEDKIAAQQQKYLERYKTLKKLNDTGDGERCVIVPQNLVNLIVEGQALHHCVGSFVDAVSEGKNTIVFLRKVEDKDTPYVTVSLMPDGKNWYIDQAHGDHNSDITEEDVAFLKTWAIKNKVRLDSVKCHYGMMGHN